MVDFNRDKMSINNHLVSLLIFLNIFQLGLYWILGSSFPLVVQYVFILMLILFNRIQIYNFYNIFVLCITILIFLVNLLLNNNLYLLDYIKEYILYGFVISFIFLFKIDFDSFSKVFFKYAIAGSFLYLLAIVISPDISANDYMTWGYFYIFCTSYLFIYLFLNDKWKLALLIIPFFLVGIIYGPKGCIFVIAATILFSFYLKCNNREVKYLLMMIIFVGLLFGKEIMYRIVLFASNYFNESYSLRTLLNLLESTSISGVLGIRMKLYKVAIEMIAEQPFGVGIGSYDMVMNAYPHNLILEMFVVLGIIGGSILLLFLVWLLISSFKKIQTKGELIFYIFFLSNMMRLVLSHSFIKDPIFWLFLSFNLSIIYKYRKNNSPNYYEKIS